MAMMRTAAVILAAGVSRRLGYSKFRLSIDGVPVIEKVVGPFLDIPLDRVIVVSGYDREIIDRDLARFDVQVVFNPDYLEGMGASVRSVLPFLADVDVALFHLGDKPFVSADFIRRLLILGEASPDKIILPVYRGEKGHPVLVPLSLCRDEMKRVAGDKGLRDVIEKHSADVICIESEESTVLDIDTEESITFLRKKGYKVEKDQG